MPDVTALVIFTDIRGFTGWSDVPEVFARLDEFVANYLKVVRKYFPSPAFVKGLGDGAMIVQELAANGTAASHGALLAKALKTIKRLEKDFADLCGHFAQTVGHQTPLRLGWGIVRGPIKKLDNDYVGTNVNKAARLCDVARPFGIVVDRVDFTDEPALENVQFYQQIRRLHGLEDVRVWVTAEIESMFVAREKLRQSPEVHVAGMCLDVSNKKAPQILIAKRSPTRSLYPGLWEGCGGQLARSETFWDGVERHYRLEMKLEVRVIRDIHCFYVIELAEESLIPGIRFLCERLSDEEPRSLNHTEIRWVSESKLKNMPATEFIPGLRDEFLALLKQYHAKKR